ASATSRRWTTRAARSSSTGGTGRWSARRGGSGNPAATGGYETEDGRGATVGAEGAGLPGPAAGRVLPAVPRAGAHARARRDLRGRARAGHDLRLRAVPGARDRRRQR